MHHSQLVKPLSASLGTFSSAWQKALQHFQRALLECGSSLELEHSQRLGILFSKKVGSTNELRRWSSLFTAEDVPACSLFLKALVYHGQWETAVQMLELNAQHKTAGDLSEYLAQFLIANDLWEQSLGVLEKMPSITAPESNDTESIVSLSHYESNLSTSFVDESKEMATNARFVPKEEQPVYCGIGATAFRAFPKNADWEKALHLIDKCTGAVSPDIGIKLLEYKAARFVYGGKKTKEFLEWSHEHRDLRKKSQTLSRILFFCALENDDLITCLNCLESAEGKEKHFLSSRRLHKFATQFMSHYKENCPLRELSTFRQVILMHRYYFVDNSVKTQVVDFFKKNGMEFSFEFDSNFSTSVLSPVSNTTNVLNCSNVHQEKRQLTITEIDKLASVLLRQNKWKEALMCLDNINKVVPQNDSETIIKNNILENSTNWEKALLFFS